MVLGTQHIFQLCYSLLRTSVRLGPLLAEKMRLVLKCVGRDPLHTDGFHTKKLANKHKGFHVKAFLLISQNVAFVSKVLGPPAFGYCFLFSEIRIA